MSTSIRDVIAREVVSNILVHRDFSSAYPAKLIIEKDWLRTENWCRPRRQGNILSDEFTPYPKNPLIANFFTAIGRSDTIGSGVKNLYKYTPIYSGGGNPEIYEADVFRIAIPLTKEAVKQVEMEAVFAEVFEYQIFIKCSQAFGCVKVLGEYQHIHKVHHLL